MNAWSTSCSECSWEGCVRVLDALRGCPRRNPNGGRCGAPFTTSSPEPVTRGRFTRPMTVLELGELTLLREWLRIPAGWVADAEGRLFRSRPKPPTWESEEGAAKVFALWEILDTDPFPLPEGRPVRFDAGMSAPEVLGEQPEQRRKREEEAVPIDDFRADIRREQGRMRAALADAPEVEREYLDGLAGSAPPG